MTVRCSTCDAEAVVTSSTIKWKGYVETFERFPAGWFFYIDHDSQSIQAAFCSEACIANHEKVEERAAVLKAWNYAFTSTRMRLQATVSEARREYEKKRDSAIEFKDSDKETAQGFLKSLKAAYAAYEAAVEDVRQRSQAVADETMRRTHGNDWREKFDIHEARCSG